MTHSLKASTLNVVFITSMLSTPEINALPGNPPASRPQNQYLTLQTFSFHFEKRDKRKGFNPTIGFESSPNRQLGWHAGVFIDSFGHSSGYLGANYSFSELTWLGERTRLLATISIVHKQFQAGRGGETKIIPSPMLEIPLYKDLLVNISGVPQINSKRHHTNGLVFAQFKYHVR
jgi:hypothetical protein